MNYDVIDAEKIEDLVEAVNQAIKYGYEPLGGIATLIHETADETTSDKIPIARYYQAMIKKN